MKSRRWAHYTVLAARMTKPSSRFSGTKALDWAGIGSRACWLRKARGTYIVLPHSCTDPIKQDSRYEWRPRRRGQTVGWKSSWVQGLLSLEGFPLPCIQWSSMDFRLLEATRTLSCRTEALHDSVGGGDRVQTQLIAEESHLRK